MGCMEPVDWMPAHNDPPITKFSIHIKIIEMNYKNLTNNFQKIKNICVDSATRYLFLSSE